MNKTKKLLLTALSVALVAIIAVFGTVAYLMDTDSDVNVMTIGNVDIAQHEYERVVNADGTYKVITVTTADGTTQESYKLQEFTQAKPLLPAVGNPNGGYTDTYARFEQLSNGASGGQSFLNGITNAQDKLVLVENTGKTNAYVRTIFAFEMGTLTDIDEWHTIIKDFTGNNGEPWSYEYAGVISIDDNNYALMEAVYTGYSTGNMRHNGGILPAGEWTYNSLAQVYMTSAATNEDVEALDGNNNGTYDILVFSQAVQADGFDNAATALDTAFGDITTTNHPWVELVSSVEELEAAIAAGDTSVVLDGDIILNDVLEVNGDLTILGNGNTITAPANGTRVVNVQDNTEDVVITLTGVTLNGGNVERGISFYNNSGALDVTIIACEIAADSYGVNIASDNANATLTVKDSTLTGWCAFQTWSANTVATFDNCILKGVNDMAYADGWTDFATVVINEGADNSTLTFNNCTIEATENSTAVQYHLWDRSVDSTVAWNNCTFIENGVETDVVLVK